MKKIGLWTSGWDRVAIDLVSKVHQNFPSEIAYVFLSREKGETLFGDLMTQKVQELGIPLITFSSLRFKPELKKKDRAAWAIEHDREVMKLLPPVDLIVWLGYMLISGEELPRRNLIINLHPALPRGPKGTYRDVIWQLIRERTIETGVMMHLVTPVLDEGPAITFCRFSIVGKGFYPLLEEMGRRQDKESLESIAEQEGETNPLFAAIRQKGVIREFPIVIWTIKVLLEGKVRVESGQVVNADGKILEGGYDLTQEIDAAIEKQIGEEKGK